MSAKDRPSCELVRADGSRLRLPEAVFEALSQYVGVNGARGEITIVCTQGGVAGVQIRKFLM